MISAATSCCLSHDSTILVLPEHSALCSALSKMYPAGAQLVTGGQPVSWGGRLSFSDFACTQALSAMAAQRPIPSRNSDGSQGPMPRVLKISTMKVCKQHSSSNGCKLGAMCRNMHVCRLAGTSAARTAEVKPLAVVRCASASRGGVMLPPIPSCTSTIVGVSARRGSDALCTLPAINMGGVAAPERSCTSPVKSARGGRLAGVDASAFRPAPPTGGRQSASTVSAADEDIVLVSTPMPSPPPRTPCPPGLLHSSTGSSCFRRFAKRWNEPLLKGGSGAVLTPSVSHQVSSCGNSIDLELVQANVNVLATTTEDEKTEVEEFSGPLPPTNASGEGRCYARRSAFDAKTGCFAVFSN